VRQTGEMRKGRDGLLHPVYEAVPGALDPYEQDASAGSTEGKPHARGRSN
jgi:hypothetical protein